MKNILVFLPALFFLPTSLSADEIVEVHKIDFGKPENGQLGYLSVEAASRDPRFFWKGGNLELRDRGGQDLLNRDFVFGKRGEFFIGLDNGFYEVGITFGDQDFGHGPFRVQTQGKTVINRLETKPGEFVSRTFLVQVDQELLRIGFEAIEGGKFFAVTAITVQGRKQTKAHTAYPEKRPSKTVPSAAEIDSKTCPDTEVALRRYCDWLLDRQTSDGCFTHVSPEWYRSSYPVRTILACHDIFDEQKFLDSATRCLDRLVLEQLPNGAWSSIYRRRPTETLPADELQAVLSGTTNTADVGTIATSLAVAIPYVDPDRRAKYLEALKRFAEDYSHQWQLPSGAFSNGRWQGKDWTVPYSVATGTQGMAFCALYAITGENRYLQVAERAVGFLLGNWNEDGRPVHHHHAEDQARTKEVTDFGDIFYYHEAILWVYHWTDNEELRDRIRRVYSWHILGSKGLLQARENEVWWPIRDVWASGKAAGMPLVTIEYARSMGDDPRVRTANERFRKFLCEDEYSRRIGVMCDPDLPWGEYSMIATGFGGLTLAEIVKPGVIFLKTKK